MRRQRRVLAVLATIVLAVTLAAAPSGRAAGAAGGAGSSRGVVAGPQFRPHQRHVLQRIAEDTWNFYKRDVDPRTHLPMDNLGPGKARGRYTSSANVGTYLWGVVAARDLHIISSAKARSLLSATLHSVRHLKRTYGFLYQWYDTTSGHVILNPGQADCSTEPTPAQDNCYFLSAVDNGWYASGLMVVRQAFPRLRELATSLLGPMDFSIFYDDRPQTQCNVNAGLDAQPTGQMYGGYYVGTGPAGYHNGALYSDPRIAMYLGMGKHQMPGDVWWRTWRTLPPKRCDTDPDFSWQGQWPAQGYWTTIHDPRSGKRFRVWEGHYTYPGTSLRFIPTYNGGMFEGLMANDVVPETSWGTRSLGLADRRLARVQIKYATEQLGYPVWGISPSSTADDTGGYNAFGAQGLRFPTGQRLAQGPCDPTVSDCSQVESTVTPHASVIALDVAPQRAYHNIVMLRRLYPGIYTVDGGFYDAVNPSTAAVGHRRLVLDQSMIMAALDNALNNRRMQRWFAADPLSHAAQVYLGAETMSLN